MLVGLAALAAPAGAQAASYAVVDADGDLVRGQNVLVSREIIDGNYRVVFKQDISQCALTAGVGDPAPAWSASRTRSRSTPSARPPRRRSS
jgi:hypothetical protein